VADACGPVLARVLARGDLGREARTNRDAF